MYTELLLRRFRFILESESLIPAEAYWPKGNFEFLRLGFPSLVGIEKYNTQTYDLACGKQSCIILFQYERNGG